MIDEAHAYQHARFAAGVTVRAGGELPTWKKAADFLVAQVTYDLDGLLAWRDTLAYDGPVYAGVMVLASSSMARRIAADIAEIDVPQQLVDALDRDRDAGVEHALTMLDRIRTSGAFDGVHLVPVSRYEQIAAGLHRRGKPATTQ
jgi:5,10-methylenetetrahydrofolate reductase